MTPSPASPTRTSVLLVGGRSGVGKSSAAAALSALLRRGGIDHAHIEGDTLDSYASSSELDPGSTALTERNLSAIWANYAAIGLRRLVYVNTVSVLEPELIARAVGDRPRITGVLLTADDDTVRERLGRRESGTSLEEHVARSADRARDLDRGCPPSVIRIPTAGRTPDEVAAEMLSAWRSADPHLATP